MGFNSLSTPKRAGVAAAALAVLGVGVMLPVGAAFAASGSVSGTVFRDFNSNGVFNPVPSAESPAVEVGVKGVVVKAFDASGIKVGEVVTDTDGSYTLEYEVEDSDQKVRLEFVDPPGFVSSMQSAASGVVSSTSVQFVSSGDVASYGVQLIDDFSVANPWVAIVANDRGYQPLNYWGSIRLVNYENSSFERQRDLATMPQTGNLWGLAAVKNTGDWVLSSAYVKRLSRIGPGGVGAIYLSDVNNPNPNAEEWVQIPNVGENPRGLGNDFDRPGYKWEEDAIEFDSIGKTGIGDIDLNAIGDKLYVVNLKDRQLYVVPVTYGTGGIPQAGTPEAMALPLELPGAEHGCDEEWVRPFGLEANGKGVYAALTCTGPERSDLYGYAYRLDEATGEWDALPTIEFSLQKDPRGVIHRDAPRIDAAWQPWAQEWERGVSPTDGRWQLPQPMFSDMEFDSNGDMTLGLRSRDMDWGYYGDTRGDVLSDHPDASKFYITTNNGDVMRACLNEESQYVLEDNDGCVGGFKPDEFYDEYILGHGEVGNGATEQIPGFPDVLATVIDPIEFNSAGYRQLSNSNGTITKPVTIPTLFDKGGGLGDIEALTGSGPLSIGNFIWIDTDRDGIQDPDEEPVPGVTVNLYDENGELIATTVTDSKGEYYFTSDEDGLLPNANYKVRLDNPNDFEVGGPLNGYFVTVVNAGDNDAIDSDGVLADGYPEIAHTTGSLGTNDHTLDFGFNNEPPIFDLALRKTLSPGQPEEIERDALVSFDITVFNQGNITATDIVVTDKLPPNTSFTTVDNPSWTIVDDQPTTTIPGPLTPGQSSIVQIKLRVLLTAADGESMVNTAEISSHKDLNGDPITDIDSEPDPDLGNDELIDDEIDKTPETGDEDDHDIASIKVKSITTTTTTTSTTVPDSSTSTTSTSVPGSSTSTIPSTTVPGSSTSTTSTSVPGSSTSTIPSTTVPGSSTSTTSTSVPGSSTSTTSTSTTSTTSTSTTSTTSTSVPSSSSVPPKPKFDLALRKRLAGVTGVGPDQPGNVQPGDDAKFDITVFNQGQVIATQIEVTDFVPLGTSFNPSNNPGWTLVDGKPVTVITGPLAPGKSTVVSIVLTVDEDVSGVMINHAEITDDKDGKGKDVEDVDSDPDDNPNDKLVDNEINKATSTGDEDDHDIASIRVPSSDPVWDLALRKRLAEGQSPEVQPGSQVTFTIEVFNQGDDTAYNIEVVDYVPDGLTFDPGSSPGWSVDGDNVTTVLAGPLDPGQFTTVDISFIVDPPASGQLLPPTIDNLAEITDSVDKDGKHPSDVDSTGDKDIDNDILEDDEIDNGGGDEDDHDIARIVPGAPLESNKLNPTTTTVAGQPPTPSTPTTVSVLPSPRNIRPVSVQTRVLSAALPRTGGDVFRLALMGGGMVVFGVAVKPRRKKASA